MENTPYAGVFAEVLKKKDHRYKNWLSQANFQLKLKCCNDLARYTTGEDVLMEVIGGVLSGKIYWDRNRVPNINTFMYHQIRGHVSNLKKKETNRLQIYTTYSDCLPEFPLRNNLNDIPGESHDEFILQQDLREIRDIILKDLAKDIVAYFVFEEIISGAKNREAADSLEITVSDVENAKKRICRIIRKRREEL